MNKFYICAKYSAKSILFTKQFIISNIVAFAFFVLFNTISYAALRAKNYSSFSFAEIHTVNYCMLWAFFTVISAVFIYDFLGTQRNNGIKMMEIKSGLKPYQIYLAKVLVVLVFTFILILAYATLILIITTLFFLDNTRIIQIYTVNLYGLLYISLIVPSIAAVLTSFNLKKTVLITCSIIISVLGLSPTLVETFFSTMDETKEDGDGETIGTWSSDKVYYYYLNQKISKDKDFDVIFNEIKSLKENTDEVLATLFVEEDNLSKESKSYYAEVIKNLQEKNLFKFGEGLELINWINAFNKNWGSNKFEVDFREIKYDQTKLSSFQKILLNVDIEFNNEKYNLSSSFDLNSFNTTKNISNFSTSFINSLESNKKSWKKMSDVILNYFKNDFYMSNYYSVEPTIYNEIIPKYLKPDNTDHELMESIDINRQMSYEKLLYKAVLFRIIQQESIILGENKPTNRVSRKKQRIEMYLNPFLWFDVTRAFGTIKLDFETVVAAQSNGLFMTYQFYEVTYTKLENNKVELQDYNYVGPNRGIMYSIALLLPILIMVGAYFVYKTKMYK
ncbi:hypothetical protein SCHIN_v1c11410 [Spiroplasma chinense]|uniref:Uncharacterized protein n=1 Tax=Spiroplasma chinense TaxID=216932 RepID=A0A5B9Y5G4_9MOLU|nr:ABC transporter permease [Spiroplasma chinense]QEH62334.1 hypothetical protein SCHIN_v1c11410 [Spiroplasma chinense]